jgi:hypothetical protein
MMSEANRERIAATSMIIFRGGSVVFILFYTRKKSGEKLLLLQLACIKGGRSISPAIGKSTA